MVSFRLVSQITRVKPATPWYNALGVLPQPTRGTILRGPSKIEKRGHGHGSLEGVGGLKTNEACHSKADALVIPEMYFFLLKFTFALFWKCLFMFVYKIRHLFRFACATGYDTGGILANRTSNAS